MSRSVEIIVGYEEHQLASTISDMYATYKMGKVEWERRVAENIQYVYATSTRETINANVGGEDGAGWSHSTHIPKITQIHDNLAANYASALLGGRNWFTFEPGDEAASERPKLKAIVSYLRTKHEWNAIETTFLKLLNDWVQTGNCFARVEYVRRTFEDLDGLEHIEYEGPWLRRISPYDIVFNHRAENFEDSPVITRTVTDRGGLLRMVEENVDLNYDPTTVQKVLDFRGAAEGIKDSDFNKEVQRQYDGFTSSAEYFKSGTVEILEFIGDIYDCETQKLKKNHIITVVDRRWILRDQPLDRIDGRRSIHHCGWRERPDNLWAMGPLDNLVGLQYRINHLENAKADAFDQMLSPDRVHVGNVQVEHDGPVTNYYIDDGNGSVTNLAPDATVLNADFQIDRLEAQMEAYAGAPREAMGIRSPGEKTKFEVQQLQNAAGRLFQHKIEYFEKNFLEKILNSELECAVRNLSTSDTIKTLDDDVGVEIFSSITSDDLTARGKIKAQGASHFAKKAQAAQEISQFNGLINSDPTLAVHFPAKARAARLAEILELPEGMYQEFGAIAEQVEQQEFIQAAQMMADESQAAAMGVEEGL